MPIDIDGEIKYSKREQRCLEFLKRSTLLADIIEEIGKKVVGEHELITTIFLCANGRLVENAKRSSYNLIVNSETRSGKDWVVENTLKILPTDYWIKRTRITEKVFTYWHSPKHEPEWTWNGKIFYNEDISNSVLNGEVFKVMASTGSIATVIVNQKPVDIEIKGKPVLIVTTASTSMSKEIMGRFIVVNCDESPEQTKEIMKRQSANAISGIVNEYDSTVVGALGSLKRVKVKIPFASKLYNLFPPTHVMMRSIYDRFLDYIKSSTALHQQQREKKNGHYIATGHDYDTARIVLLKTMSNPSMIPLTKDERRIIDVIRKSSPPLSTNEILTKVSEVSQAQM